jgi:AcrR family transcriptional regulator
MRHGVRDVKMDDIAHHLSISKRTLYEIYCNKEDLLLEVVRHHVEETHKYYAQLIESASNVMDILIGITRHRMKVLNEVSPDFIRDLANYPSVAEMSDRMSDQRHEESIRIIKRGIDEGYFLPNVNYELMGRIEEALFQDRVNYRHDASELRDYFYIYILIFIRSICTEAGLKILDPFLEEIKEAQKA